MGATKQTWLEKTGRNYVRNGYYRERRKLRDRIRLYGDNPNFVAVLERELKALEQDWKAKHPKKSHD